jgi:hypothetical protein
MAREIKLGPAFFDRRENPRSTQTSNKRNVTKGLTWITIVALETLYP